LDERWLACAIVPRETPEVDMKRFAVAVVTASSVSGWVFCSPFKGDGSGAEEGAGGLGECHCTAPNICCVAADLTSSCKTLGECPTDQAAFACRLPSDCPGQRCCAFARKYEGDSSFPIPILQSVCLPRCNRAMNQFTVCEGQTDCEAGLCTAPGKNLVPSAGYTLCQ
jgi:hypothetical protein